MKNSSAARDFEGSTEYNSFVSNAKQTTTSNGWVNKASHQTGQDVSAGRYIVHFQADLSNSDRHKSVGYRVQWSIEGVTALQTIHNTKDGASVDNQFLTRSGFKEITVSTSGKINISIDFGQTDDGGTGKIKNSNVYIFRVGD